MFKPLKHPHVKILEGVTQLVGQTGVITGKEEKHYRVKLNQPVDVPGVGLVTSDLWLPSALKVIRPVIAKPAKPKPVVSTDAPPFPGRPQTQLADAEQVLVEAAAAAPEAPAGAPVEAPAPQPAPEAPAHEAGTSATPAANARNTKAWAAKPKALSAKQEAQKRAGLKVTGGKPKGRS